MGSILRPTKIADFFHDLCDAITDVIFYVYRCDIFEKKTFDSMRFRMLCDCHPCLHYTCNCNKHSVEQSVGSAHLHAC